MTIPGKRFGLQFLPLRISEVVMTLQRAEIQDTHAVFTVIGSQVFSTGIYDGNPRRFVTGFLVAVLTCIFHCGISNTAEGRNFRKLRRKGC